MSDIVERLRATYKGDSLVAEAIDEIERLRSICGKAEVGRSFNELTKGLSRRPAEPKDEEQRVLRDKEAPWYDKDGIRHYPKNYGL